MRDEPILPLLLFFAHTSSPSSRHGTRGDRVRRDTRRAAVAGDDDRFFSSSLLCFRATLHTSPQSAPRTPYHTARRARLPHSLTNVSCSRRYSVHTSCITTYIQSQCARVHSVDPAERPLVRPPSRSFVRSFVPPSVRPSCRRASSRLCSFASFVHRRHARFTGS